jgi:hypothetical protein
MPLTMSVRKPDALKDAQLRLKALTCETASLREDLRRESTRKVYALEQVQNQQSKSRDAQVQLNTTRFTTRCVSIMFAGYFNSMCKVLKTDSLGNMHSM